MTISDLYKKLTDNFGSDFIYQDVSMKDHTTMKVGGKVDLMIEPSSISILRESLSLLNSADIPYMVIGNGSNTIFTDQGYNGVIIKIGSKLAKVEIKDNTIIAMAGASLAAVANKAMEISLTGLEFASGIPGSIGGAVFMNAGAYGGEMSQVVVETLSINKKGEFVTLSGEDNKFSYRHSKMQEDELICVQVVLELKKGHKSEILAMMKDLNSRRRDKQPLELPSAGSVFKRPPNNFAGKLIEDCGLRGTKIGGAQVSEKHCGFIVNTGNATASDVINLIKYVQDTVFKNTGILLELEVKIIGGK